ncbi:MAG TPA: manganese efflux pump [Candidatus Limnocylindria bacterium]|nr:manganese efflux pump [Candidatus Limnocylindria bacterium]
MLRLVALMLPLCLDTFAMSAALGIAGLSDRRRLTFSLVMACFEGGMPLVGLFLGAALGQLIGDMADYVAVMALGGLGAYVLLADEEKEEGRIKRLATATGIAMLMLGLTVSVDELAIGFVFGLLDVPIVPALIAIAAQAFVVSQVGFALGGKVGERFRAGAERLAGVLLIALAGLVLVSRLVSLPS